MPAGNCSAQNTASSLMVKCPQIKLQVVEMMLLTPFSQKLELANTCLVAFSSISNLPLLIKLELEHIVNYSIPSNLSLVNKMPPTILLEVITLLVNKLSIFAQTELENQLITVQVFKAFQYSIQQVEVLDQDQDLYYLNVSQLITVKSQNLDSLFIHHLKFQQLLQSHITQFFQLTLYYSILMWLLCLITKLFTIYAEEILIQKGQHTLT